MGFALLDGLIDAVVIQFGEKVMGKYSDLTPYVLNVGWGAVIGTFGAVINEHIGYETITPIQAAIAGAVGAAIIALLWWFRLAVNYLGDKRWRRFE